MQLGEQFLEQLGLLELLKGINHDALVKHQSFPVYPVQQMLDAFISVVITHFIIIICKQQY